MKILSNIWVLMILSVVLFLGTSYYLWTQAAGTPPELPATMHDKEVDGAAVAALWNTQTGHIEQVEQELKKRMRDLDEREASLDQMDERIKAEMIELKNIQEAIAKQEASLDSMIHSIEASKVKNIRSQATVYSNMDPESVIQIFYAMSDTEVAELLYFMNSDAQAGIFAAFIEAPVPVAIANDPSQLKGAAKVARLQEILKYTQPPQKK